MVETFHQLTYFRKVLLSNHPELSFCQYLSCFFMTFRSKREKTFLSLIPRNITHCISLFLTHTKHDPCELLREFADIFMRHEAEFGVSTLLKQGSKLVSNVDPSFEGTKKLTNDKLENLPRKTSPASSRPDINVTLVLSMWCSNGTEKDRENASVAFPDNKMMYLSR